jgi:hypothetical protein
MQSRTVPSGIISPNYATTAFFHVVLFACSLIALPLEAVYWSQLLVASLDHEEINICKANDEISV